MPATIVSRQGGRRYPQTKMAGGLRAYGPASLFTQEVSITVGAGGMAFTESGPLFPVTLTANVLATGGGDGPVTFIWEIDGQVVQTSSSLTLTTNLTAGPHSVLLTSEDGTLPPVVATSTMLIAVGVTPASRVYRNRITMG